MRISVIGCGYLGAVHSAAMETRIKDLTRAAQALLAQNLRVQKRLFELETLVDVRTIPKSRHRTSACSAS